MRKRKNLASPKINVQAFADAITSGTSLHDAMLAAGYSEACAKRGRASLSPACNRAWLLRLKTEAVDGELSNLGSSVTPDDMHKLIKGRLTKNVIEGHDKAVASVKAMGQLRDVNAFQPDTALGVMFLELPALPKGHKPDTVTLDMEAMKMLPAGPDEVVQLVPTDPKLARYHDLLSRRSSYFSLVPGDQKITRDEMGELAQLESELGKKLVLNPAPQEMKSNG